MKKKIILIILTTININCFSQDSLEIKGLWSSDSGKVMSDIFVFRSDNNYFIYNSENVNTNSLGKTRDLPDDDIMIDEAYTSLIESGKWKISNGKLILYERNFLEKWYDFLEIYGKSKELILTLNKINDNNIEICKTENNENLFCEKLSTNFTQISKTRDKRFYNEISKEIENNGSLKQKFELSGYERNLKISYDFFDKPDKLIIRDGSGHILFNSSMTSTVGYVFKELKLRGVTDLYFEINSRDNESFWKICVDIK